MAAHTLASIHPSESVHAPAATPPPLVYEIVASEQLPSFDPTVSIKHLFMSEARALRFAHFSLATRPVAIPVYFIGLALRVVTVFVSVRVAEVLAVLSVICQTPTIVIVILAFRLEYVKVLVCTFEFGFMVLTATTWTVAAFCYIRDWRAVLLPIVWVDFIDLTLIEALFGQSTAMVVIAIASGLFFTSLTVKSTLGDAGFATSSRADTTSVYTTTPTHRDPAVSTNDALANAMGTMVMLMVRLAYRKYAIAKRELRGVSWTQSIGYRCRVALRAVPPSTEHPELLRATPLPAGVVVTSRAAVAPDALATRALPTTATTRTMRRAQPTRKRPMRFIAVPTRFRADDTVSRRIGRSNEMLTRVQLIALYGIGAIGYLLSTLAAVAANRSIQGRGRDSSSSDVDPATEPLTSIWVALVAIAGLSATLSFCGAFALCYQRQLLRQLCTSFDVAFLSLQLISSHASLCELMAWDWRLTCSVVAEWVWLHWALLLDALTPAMKARLRLRPSCGAPIVLLHLLKNVAFLVDVLLGSKRIRNRLLLNVVVAGYTVQFRTFPFLFSRLVTVLIWCVRILHRIRTQQTDSDLVMLLGNVEFDCRQTKLEDVSPAPSPLRPDDTRE